MFWGTFLARPFTKETAGLFKRVAEAVPQLSSARSARQKSAWALKLRFWPPHTPSEANHSKEQDSGRDFRAEVAKTCSCDAFTCQGGTATPFDPTRF